MKSKSLKSKTVNRSVYKNFVVSDPNRFLTVRSIFLHVASCAGLGLFPASIRFFLESLHAIVDYWDTGSFAFIGFQWTDLPELALAGMTLGGILGAFLWGSRYMNAYNTFVKQRRRWTLAAKRRYTFPDEIELSEHSSEGAPAFSCRLKQYKQHSTTLSEPPVKSRMPLWINPVVAFERTDPRPESFFRTILQRLKKLLQGHRGTLVHTRKKQPRMNANER